MGDGWGGGGEAQEIKEDARNRRVLGKTSKYSSRKIKLKSILNNLVKTRHEYENEDRVYNI